jgi:hypothetical protein
MKTAKEEIRGILERLPEDASFEDIQYHIYVCQKVARGEADAREDRTLTQAQVEERLTRWLGK